MVEKRQPQSERSSRIKQQNIYENADQTTRKTKVVCQLGPECYEVDKLVKMLDAGMNVATLNFAGGDYKTHLKALENLKEALKQREDKQCSIMLDTKGPEIKTCALRENKDVTLKKGQDFIITIDAQIEGDNTRVACTYKQLCETVIVGSTIFIDDGALQCEVKEIQDNGVKVIVQNDFVLGERKNMSLPGAIVDLPSITEKDESDIREFGIKYGCEIIAASFVRKAQDIEDVRELMGENGKTVKIYAKIENREGLSNFEEIVAVSDGIIVQRVALAQEIPSEKVFIAQKFMIEKANYAAKPIILFGNIIQSMEKSDKPTRAEASDIAIAVLDGADGLMAGEETSTGEYPIETCQMIASICAEAERCLDHKRGLAYVKQFTKKPTQLEALAYNAASQVLDSMIDLIIVQTETGTMPRVMAKYKPSVPIFAVSTDQLVVRQLTPIRGIISYKISDFSNFDTLRMLAIERAKHLGLCKSGRKVIFLHGNEEERPDSDPRLKLIDVD